MLWIHPSHYLNFRVKDSTSSNREWSMTANSLAPFNWYFVTATIDYEIG